MKSLILPVWWSWSATILAEIPTIDRFWHIEHWKGSPCLGRSFSICLDWLLLGARLSMSVRHLLQLGLRTIPCLLRWFFANCSTGNNRWQILQIFRENLSPVRDTSIGWISYKGISHSSSFPINQTLPIPWLDHFNKSTEFLGNDRLRFFLIPFPREHNPVKPRLIPNSKAMKLKYW